ncbi:uncharacterized protein LOC113462836 [Phoenix dactylifera]|uniref:Uncharacterized protein LOC113462836 n=1 Tax=Phoenix dactylifera TaxID=42345 RepID=A0A8B8J5J8_PHODC|nr:uncharacterized protein LOC113462836 [Phoenix dactylifera]
MGELAIAGHAQALLEWHNVWHFFGHCGAFPMMQGAISSAQMRPAKREFILELVLYDAQWHSREDVKKASTFAECKKAQRTVDPLPSRSTKCARVLRKIRTSHRTSMPKREAGSNDYFYTLCRRSSSDLFMGS